MKNRVSLIILFLFTVCNLFSQKVDSEILINNIKKDVTDFFVKKRVLEKAEIKESLNYVFIIEMLNEKVIGFDKNGIYVISVHQSHSEKHILIKEGLSYKIIDLKNINLALKEIIDYSLRNELEEKNILSYIKITIKRYEDNVNINSVPSSTILK